MTTSFITTTAGEHDIPLVATTFTFATGAEEPLVRLVPEALVKAEELAMQTLGLELGESQSVGFVPKRAIGFPAWPILTDPDNAQHALNLVADIEWARRNAKNQAGNVKKRVDGLYTVLQSSAPHFLPTFLEEVARIFATVDNNQYAKQYFAKAREVERAHGIAVDPERHQQAFMEFAALGVVGARELTVEANDALNRMAARQAYDYFENLIISRAKNGTEAYAHALRDLKKIGTAAGKNPKDLEVEFAAKYVPTKGFYTSSKSMLKKLLPAIKAAKQDNPEVGAALLKDCPREWSLDEYVTELQTVDLWDELVADAEGFAEWFITLFTEKSHTYFFDKSNPDLIAAIERNQAAFSQVVVQPDFSYRVSTNLDYFDVLLAAGVTWQPNFNSYGHRFEFDSWVSNGRRDLEQVLRNDVFHQSLMEDLSAWKIKKNLDKLLSFGSTRVFLSQWLDKLTAEKTKAAGSHTLMSDIHRQREQLTDQRLKDLNPSAMAEIFHLDVAAEFALRLNRGTLVEYTWPTLEQVCHKHQTNDIKYFCCYPYIAVAVDNTVTVVDGDNTQTITIPTNTRVNQVFVVDDQVLIIYFDRNSYKKHYLWSKEGVGHEMKDTWRYLHDFDGNAQLINGALQVGTTSIAPGAAITEVPAGFVHGTDPYYLHDGSYDSPVIALPVPSSGAIIDYHQGVVDNALLGLDTSSLDFSHLPDSARIRKEECYYIPTTETTKDSPLGIYNDCLVGFSFDARHDEDAPYIKCWVSPLGSFNSDSAQYFKVLRRPGGGFWYLTKNSLIDADTNQPITDSLDETGAILPLNKLPHMGYHQLKVRNDKASAALRACTAQQAQTLIDRPERILKFVNGDEVLAAAVSGILTQIYAISPNPVAVNQPQKPARYLKYFFEQLGAKATSVSSRSLPNPPEISDTTYDYLRRIFNVHSSSWEETLQECKKIAAHFNHPQPGQQIDIGHSNPLVELISKEKYLLARLAAPAIPVSVFIETSSLFTWLANIGWLGKLRMARLSPQHQLPQGMWHDNTLVLYSGWREAVAVFPSEAAAQAETSLGKHWTGVAHHDWFMPKEKFLSQLKTIQAWRNDLSDEDLQLYTANLRTAATNLAKVTSMPCGAWHLTLTGLLPKDTYSYVFSAEAAKFIGIKTPMLSALNEYIDSLGYPVQEMIAAAWHKDYFTTGPDIDAIAQIWQAAFGTPWIHLNDDEVKVLSNHSGYNHIARELIHEKPYQVNSGRLEYRIFTQYLVLSQLVQPQSPAAVELARRIELFRQYQPPRNTIALGGKYEDTEKGGDQGWATDHAPRVLLEGHLDGLLEWLQHGTPTSGDPQNPHNSAPDTVTEAATTLGISPDAACYFLQILTLANPTDTLIKKYNGWQKKQLDAVRAELVDKQLVLQAQRAGTGRSVFLAGGWLQKSDTGPAMETWKAPHYLLWKDNKTRPVIPSCPPLLPYSELFVETWQRYIAGDTPGYEELRTARYRRKR